VLSVFQPWPLPSVLMSHASLVLAASGERSHQTAADPARRPMRRFRASVPSPARNHESIVPSADMLPGLYVLSYPTSSMESRNTRTGNPLLPLLTVWEVPEPGLNGMRTFRI
jgi:hypothetical protein